MTLRRALACAAFLLPLAAHASFLSGDALDAAADVLSWIVIVLVPALAIGLFLFVHVLPEKIAEKRQHPHKDSIKVLCILSLFFGGLLWPFAWLWAYTKPIGYRAIYGSEKHDDYYIEEGEKALAGKLSAEEVEHLRLELVAMQAKGPLSAELRRLSDRLERLHGVPVAAAAAPPVRSVRSGDTVTEGTR
jgi:CBS domain containing-hemolysin-like protein